MENQYQIYCQDPDDENYLSIYKRGLYFAIQELVNRGYYHPQYGPGHLSIEEAIDDIMNGFICIAKKYYKLGSKHGFGEACQLVYDGDLEVIELNGFSEITSKKDSIEWDAKLSVNVGNNKKRCDVNCELDLEELGFKFCYKGKYKFSGTDN